MWVGSQIYGIYVVFLSLCFFQGSDGSQFLTGFTHAAFALGYEAGINKSTVDGNLVPPGALVTFVQKGIQYLELEANLSCVSTLPLVIFLL